MPTLGTRETIHSGASWKSSWPRSTLRFPQVKRDAVLQAMDLLVQQIIIHHQFSQLGLKLSILRFQVTFLGRLSLLKRRRTPLQKRLFPVLQNMRRLTSCSADFFKGFTLQQRDRHLGLALAIPTFVFLHTQLQLHQNKQSKVSDQLAGQSKLECVYTQVRECIFFTLAPLASGRYYHG